jgi:hypothetical protein
MVDEVEKNENMNEADASLIKAVATFAHSTTLHVKEVFRGESYGVYGKRNPIFRRVFYFIVWISGLIYMCTLIRGYLEKYQSNATYINTNVIMESSMELPSITVCNNNQFPASIWSVNNEDDLIGKDRLKYTIHNGASGVGNVGNEWICIPSYEIMNTYNISSSCLKVNPLTNPGECCKTLGKWIDYIDLLFGVCSVWNWNEGIAVNNHGKFITMVIKENNDNIQPIKASLSSNGNSNSNGGMYVSIHDKTINFNDALGYNINKGTSKNINIKKTVFNDVKIKSKTKPICATNAKEMPSNNAYRVNGGLPSRTSPYSINDCRLRCVEKSIISLCKCSTLASYQYSTTSTTSLLKKCDTIQEKECINDIKKTTIKFCYDFHQCPTVCERTTYDANIATYTDEVPAATVLNYNNIIYHSRLTCQKEFVTKLKNIYLSSVTSAWFAKYPNPSGSGGSGIATITCGITSNTYQTDGTNNEYGIYKIEIDANANSNSNNNIKYYNMDPNCASLKIDEIAKQLIFTNSQLNTFIKSSNFDNTVTNDNNYILSINSKDTLFIQSSLKWIYEQYEILINENENGIGSVTIPTDRNMITIGWLYENLCGSRNQVGPGSNDNNSNSYQFSTISAETDNNGNHLVLTKVKRPNISYIKQSKIELSKDMTSFTVGYQILSTTYTYQNLIYNMESLFADIGGITALFIGMSILSLIEVIEFIFIFLTWIYNEYIENKLIVLKEYLNISGDSDSDSDSDGNRNGDNDSKNENGMERNSDIEAISSSSSNNSDSSKNQMKPSASVVDYTSVSTVLDDA